MEAIELRLLLDGFLHSFDHFVVEELLVELLCLDKHASFLAEFAPEFFKLLEHVPSSINVLFVCHGSVQFIEYDLKTLYVDQ